jgi:hypothetical protein
MQEDDIQALRTAVATLQIAPGQRFGKLVAIAAAPPGGM